MREEYLGKAAFVKVRTIFHTYAFLSAGNLGIELLHKRRKALGKRTAAFEDRNGESLHPVVDDFKQGEIRGSVLEEFIPLCKQSGIILHGIQILGTHLGKDSVAELAALFPALAYHRNIRRRHHHHRQQTDMVGKPGVGLVIPAELLARGIHLHADTGIRPGRKAVQPRQGEALTTMAEIETVGRREGTFGHREIPYSIQKIGLPLTVAARNAVDVRAEFKFLQRDVAEVLYHYLLDVHNSTKVKKYAYICKF